MTQYFHENAVIGVIGDGWVALRMEEMIKSGRSIPVTEPKAGEPGYRRILRKIDSW